MEQKEMVDLNNQMMKGKINNDDYLEHFRRIYSKRSRLKVEVDYDISDIDISIVCKKMGVSNIIAYDMVNIRDKIFKITTPSLIGLTPRSFISGLFFVCAKRGNVCVTLDDIYENIGTTQVTIRKAMMKIEELL